MNKLEPSTFALEVPLYSKIKITDENRADFKSLLYKINSFTGYSPKLKEPTTYKLQCTQRYGDNIEHYIRWGGYGVASLKCSRDESNNNIYFYYDEEAEEFQKVGQHLSIADFHISKIKEYDKLLSTEKLKEFSRAIGLAANGVGIGSFVYLRRIFEYLIEEAHSKEKLITGWNEEEFLKARMTDKIGLLKNNLPEVLI